MVDRELNEFKKHFLQVIECINRAQLIVQNGFQISVQLIGEA